MSAKKLDPEIVRVAAAYALMEQAKRMLNPELEPERVTVGRFEIEKLGAPGMIWIEDKEGSAILTDEKDLAAAIENFFKEQFKKNQPTKET